jgi:hypothetical protein
MKREITGSDQYLLNLLVACVHCLVNNWCHLNTTTSAGFTITMKAKHAVYFIEHTFTGSYHRAFQHMAFVQNNTRNPFYKEMLQ